MSIITLGDDLHSQLSESELSETLNTTAFETTTHATAGDLPNKENEDDLVQINGRTYIAVSRTANHRAGSVPSWIWDHGRELRLAGQNPQRCWQCTFCGKVMPVDSTTYYAGQHLENKHRIHRSGHQSEELNPPP